MAESERQVRNVAILYLTLSVLSLAAWAIAVAVYGPGLETRIPHARFIAVVNLFMVVAMIVAAIGLFRLRTWGRTLAILTAALNLPAFPLGTASALYALWVLLDGRVKALFTRPPLPLHKAIFINLIAGAFVGGALHAVVGSDSIPLSFVAEHITNPVGQVFLRLLLLLVVPLVFASLTLGIAGLGDLRRIGRIGVKSLVYTVIMSAISVVIGLTLANTIKPGKRLAPEVRAQLSARYGGDAARTVATATTTAKTPDTPLMKVVKTIVPTNVFAAVSKDPPDMLGLMFFTLFFGIAITLVPREQTATFLGALEGLYAAVQSGIQIVMRFAPYAVFCLLFTLTARFGFELLSSLGWFVGTVLLGLAIHMFGVYSLSVALLSRINPLEFFKRIKTAMITAFSTSSSNATLPTALRVSEENLGVPRDINSFVLTIGATANQNGTALYEGVTVLFLAQLAGVDLTMSQQLMVVYLAILGGIGTAGVPSGSIPFIVLVLAQIGVNPALIAIIIGIDRILDMCRTVLNVTGDITIATYVARSEGAELMREIPEPPQVDL